MANSVLDRVGLGSSVLLMGFCLHQLFFFLFKDLFNVYEYTELSSVTSEEGIRCLYVYGALSACTPARQKRASELIINSCQPPCACWALNSEPLEEQRVL